MRIINASILLTVALILNCVPVRAATTKDLYMLYEVELPSEVQEVELKLKGLSHAYGLQGLAKMDSEIQDEYVAIKSLMLSEEIASLENALNEASEKVQELQERLQEEKAWLPSQELFGLIDEWRDTHSKMDSMESKLNILTMEWTEKQSYESWFSEDELDITPEQLSELRSLVEKSVSFTEIGDLNNVPYPVLTYPVIYPNTLLVQRASPGASVISLFDGKVHRVATNEIWVSHGAEVYTVYRGVDRNVKEIGEQVLQHEKFALAGSKGYIEVELWIANQKLNLERIKLNSIYNSIEVKG